MLPASDQMITSAFHAQEPEAYSTENAKLLAPLEPSSRVTSVKAATSAALPVQGLPKISVSPAQGQKAFTIISA